MDGYGTFRQYVITHRQDFDALLFDVDGTLSYGGRALSGAKELLEYLNKNRVPYLLMTNDAGNSPEQKAAILNRAGIPVSGAQVLSAGNALTWWSKHHDCSGKLFFLYGKLGDPSFADEAGIKVTSDPGRAGECSGVIAGEGYFDWQIPVEAAFNLLLKHPEYPFIVPNPDCYWPSLKFDGMGIGSGALARLLQLVLKEAHREISPVYLGKPYSPVYQCVFDFLKKSYPQQNFSTPSRIIMVGDSLSSDIAGANANNLTSALVLTGITDIEAAKNASAEKKPALIFKSV